MLTQWVCPPVVCAAGSNVTIPSIVRNVWWAAKRAIVAIVWDSIESSTPAYAGCFPCGDSNSRRVSSYRSRITGHSSIQIRPNHRGRDRLAMPPPPNAQAVFRALPRVVEIMAKDLGWNHSRQHPEIGRATKFLTNMDNRHI